MTFDPHDDRDALRAVVVEEHHEAFIVWRHARTLGWIPGQPVTLLHVDEFADMGIPRLSRPVKSLGDVSDTAAFTYSELTRNNYIWPAVYDGLFDRVIWLRVRHSPQIGGSRTLRIAAQTTAETSFFATDPSRPGLLDGCGTAIQYVPATIADPLPPAADRLVVSVDLSYFCQDFPKSPPLRKLEITRQAYDEFLHDRYHFLRLSLHSDIVPFEIGGRHYLVFNDGEPHDAVLTDLQVVSDRIDGFVRYLLNCGRRIDLLILARSCHSGLVDSTNADFAERRILTELGRRWPLKTLWIDDLIDVKSALLEREVAHA